ncbi:ribosome small subunit-dependent GTPase A [Coralloluteibacterium thermophilus]|uniref:Small ribosomal subunit biogenesis GTPase RsgA n=1 Tax=Coralloluteibacterium thermophilum TaxID=2707049 RepID=A0ABV9NL33_9GAMM
MQIDNDALAPLLPLGWPDDAEARAALAAAPGARLARISEQHRSGYIACTAAGSGFPVQAPAPWLRPRFPPEERAVVGDWVALEADADQIVALLPRRSLLKRAAAGEHYRQQLIAANVDHVLVVSGLDGDFNPRRIERYLVVVQGSGSQPVVVLTKADRNVDVRAHLDAVAELAPGVPVHALDARDAAEVAVLARYLGPGRSAVVVGSSGAGKSTLTNTLLGTERMRTSAVRETDSRGRHTTTYRALIPLPQGGCLIDTPGMRELKLSGEEDLAEGGFDDVEALAAECRFRDCSHAAEPGCAVRAALEAGRLDRGRFANYLKLRAELASGAEQRALRLAQRAEEKIPGKPRKRPSQKYPRR